METITLVLISTLLAGLYYLYNKVRDIHSFFEDRGIPYIPATFPFGSSIRRAIQSEHWTETFEEMYKKLKKHKVSGIFTYIRPVYFVTDPECINKMFVRDFTYFYDRGAAIDEKVNPLDGHLFFLTGQKWRYLRQKLSPIFTSGKLRWMYEEMEKCSKNFFTIFDRHVGKEVDLKEDLSCFTTDVIGSTAFGIDTDSMNNQNSRFRIMGKRVFEFTFLDGIKFAGRLFFPHLLIKLKTKTVPPEIDDFFTSLITQSFDNRIKTGAKRKDIVQLLLELKQKGSVDIDSQDKVDAIEEADGHDNETLELNDGLLAAQSFVFFVAGFETTSTTLYYCLYLLSKNQECQDKAREEIKQVKAKFGGKIEYECLKELEYLENCINETLRMYAPVPFLMRECTKNYTFPTGAKIEKGNLVIIPIHSLHHDHELFPDPEAFKPERFSQQPKPGSYAPFGDGPRICIGKRFALTEIKMLLAKLLDSYLIEKSDRTEEPVKFMTTSSLTTPITQLYIKIKKL